ncbi:MAG: nucleoside triphosphate pyrophosphohydrolase [Clostridia bacterium]|nr:nucleoside triphosphate pyrophosphohydrolase [Clostridia bacterium]
MITVVGLGNEKGDLTERGKTAILTAVQNGDKIAVRTGKTRSYESVLALGVEHTCLDCVYEKSRSFKTLNDNLAKAVLALGENTVYLVDGSASEDNSVKALVRKTREKLQIIGGVSKTTAIAEKANFKSCSYTAVSAYEIFEKAKGGLSLPLLVYDLDDQALASDVKLLLGELFGDEIKGKYVIGNTAKVIGMYELDRQRAYDYSSAFAIDEVDLLDKKRFRLEDLIEIVERLRAPDGCPWDKVQTPESIKMSAIEEAYELVDAIDSGDYEKVLEETGDVILQAVFQAVMRQERGEFTMTDALTNLCEKLIFRHSHVFGKDKAKDEQSALSVWEKNKMQEKHQMTYADSVNDVPKAFPAALRAQKIGKRAAKAGLDFDSVASAVEALKGEIQEFLTAYENGDKQNVEKELGDVLFSAVNVGRKADCDTEKALKESAERFAKRFTIAERLALSDGKTVTELSAEEWDKYYRAAKAEINEADNA